MDLSPIRATAAAAGAGAPLASSTPIARSSPAVATPPYSRRDDPLHLNPPNATHANQSPQMHQARPQETMTTVAGAQHAVGTAEVRTEHAVAVAVNQNERAVRIAAVRNELADRTAEVDTVNNAVTVYKPILLTGDSEWPWVAVEDCMLCNEFQSRLCGVCKAKVPRPPKEQCPIAFSACSKNYHEHCIANWLKCSGPDCPAHLTHHWQRRNEACEPMSIDGNEQAESNLLDKSFGRSTEESLEESIYYTPDSS